MDIENFRWSVPVLAFSALAAGTIAPPLVGAVVGTDLVNPIWGTIYGAGFFAWDWLFGMPSFGNLGALYVFFGALIWPAIITLMNFFILSKSIRMRPAHRRLYTALFISTLLVLLPNNTLGNLYFYADYFDR